MTRNFNWILNAGIHPNQANAMDCECRMLLEKTIEAIYDAGIHPKDLEGTNTGVFIGLFFTEAERRLVNQQSGSNLFCVG